MRAPSESAKVRKDFLDLLRVSLRTFDGDVRMLSDHLGVRPSSIKRWLSGRTYPKPSTMYRCAMKLRESPVSLLDGITIPELSRMVRGWRGTPFSPDYQNTVLVATVLLVNAVKKSLPDVFQPYQVYLIESDVPQGVAVLQGKGRPLEIRILVTLEPGSGGAVKLVYTSPDLPEERVTDLLYEERSAWKIRNLIKPMLESHATTPAKNGR